MSDFVTTIRYQESESEPIQEITGLHESPANVRFPFSWKLEQTYLDNGLFTLDITIDQIKDPNIILHSAEILWDLSRIPQLEKVFVNGFQSWTDSREFGTQETIPKISPLTKLVKMQWYGDYHFHQHSGEIGYFHGYTYAYARTGSQGFYLWGSTSEDLGYTMFQFQIPKNRLRIQKDLSPIRPVKGQKIWSLLAGERQTKKIFFEQYFRLWQINTDNIPPMTGWTSWYNYYTNINEEIILSNLQAFKKNNIPIDIFQIDDGFQKHVGDWLNLKQEKFSNGMARLTQQIHEHGFKAGLWLAPFVCEKKSWIVSQKPDWIKKNKQGKFMVAGWNPMWSGNFYVLDLYHEEVRQYLQKVFHTVLDQWGFDMVKLDFLYAVAIEPTKEKSRGQIMREAMVFLRELVGSKMILGCGVPLGPSFGLVDYCRIGSDIALKWEDQLLNKVHYRERVSTINSLTSTIGRHDINGYAFGNDPDVFLLRSDKNKLNKEQKNTLFILNNIFGRLVFTSDNIAQYDSQTMALYQSMFPLKKKKILAYNIENQLLTVLFQIDDKEYLVYSNHSKKEQWFEIPLHWYFAATHGFVRGGTKIRIKPYATLCFLRLPTQVHTIAGSLGHIFPGSEVKKLTYHPEEHNFELQLENKLPYSPKVYILTQDKKKYTVNTVPLMAKEMGEGLHILEYN